MQRYRKDKLFNVFACRHWYDLWEPIIVCILLSTYDKLEAFVVVRVTTDSIPCLCVTALNSLVLHQDS